MVSLLRWPKKSMPIFTKVRDQKERAVPAHDLFLWVKGPCPLTLPQSTWRTMKPEQAVRGPA